MSNPKRVFILGLQRSGTTWLANMLAALPQVAAVQHEDHQGVHESVYFSHFARNFGPWDEPSARRQFAEAFKHSDYYRLTELDEELPEEMIGTHQSYGEVFITMMDLYCMLEQADVWIEKSPHHTLLSEDIRRAAPDAQFVMVERDLPDLMASRLHGFGRTPGRSIAMWFDLARGTVTASLYQREMRRIARSGQGILVRYEDLKADADHTVRQSILDYIGIDADPSTLISAYRPNSSFERGTPVALSPNAKRYVRIVAGLSRLVPLTVLRSLQARRDAARGADWPDWVWQQTGYDPVAAAERSDDRVILNAL